LPASPEEERRDDTAFKDVAHTNGADFADLPTIRLDPRSPGWCICGGGDRGGVLTQSAYIRLAAAVLAAASLAACASQPASTIAADDEALCQYSAAAGAAATDAKTYERCRAKLAGQRAHLASQNAGRIEGYALLPAQSPAATDIAGRCKNQAEKDAKDCTPADVTGTIPAVPKR
jgi:hypothetical protein